MGAGGGAGAAATGVVRMTLVARALANTIAAAAFKNAIGRILTSSSFLAAFAALLLRRAIPP